MKPIHNLTSAMRTHVKHPTKPLRLPLGQIRWLIGRMHVGTSALVVARDIWRRTAYPRAVKRAMVRYALLEHRKNRDLYVDVMRGRV